MTSLADLGLTPFRVNLILFLVSAFCAAAFIFVAVLFYLRAVGSYKMAKKLRLKHPWYSFIPFMRSYHLGLISDQRKNRYREKVRPLAKALLALEIISAVMYGVFSSMFTKDLVGLVFSIDSALASGRDFVFSSGVFSNTLPVLCGALAAGAAFKAAQFVALRRVYAMFFESGAITRLVLSVIFPFLTPIFIYIGSKNEPHIKSRSSDNDGAFSYGIQ